MVRTYPPDVTTRLAERWQEGGASEVPLPGARALHEIVETAYHASFLHEEQRPLRFRILVASPGAIPACTPTPQGLQLLEFDPSRLLSDSELRRLAPAADFERTLIGVHAEGEGAPFIWGLAASGVRWMRQIQRGRDSQVLPDALVVHILSPGHLLLARGTTPLLEVQGGHLRERGHDVFRSQWLHELFAPMRREVTQSDDGSGDGDVSPLVGDAVVGAIAQHMLRRAIAAIRRARHGGTLIVVPSDDSGETSVPGITLKYRFAEQATRRRFQELIRAVISALRDLAAREGIEQVDGAFYEQREDPELRMVEDAVVELGQLIASLAAVDGAVVMNRRFELLGFGGEITVSAVVPSIKLALDLEAEQTVTEVVDSVGTRHRSAYRLAKAYPGTLSFVVSQDGTVTVVHARGGDVICWDQKTFGL